MGIAMMSTFLQKHRSARRLGLLLIYGIVGPLEAVAITITTGTEGLRDYVRDSRAEFMHAWSAP